MATANEADPGKGLKTICGLGAGVIKDYSDTVSGTVCKSEVRRIHVVVQNPVPTQLMQYNAPVACDADRIRGVTQFGKFKIDVSNTVAITVTGCIALNSIGREIFAAMVY